MKREEIEKLINLRETAEKLLKNDNIKKEDLEKMNLPELFHELQVYQIELEIQNDELRKQQQKMEISRNKYLDLYDFAPIAYFTIDKNGVILETNLTGSKLLGRTRNNVIRKPLTLFLEKEYHSKFYQHRKKVLASNIKQSIEIKLVVNEEIVYGKMESVSVERENEQSKVIRTAITDITEQKKLEQNLYQSERKFRLLAENADDMIFKYLLYPEEKYEYISPACHKLTGYFQEEFYKNPFIIEKIIKKKDKAKLDFSSSFKKIIFYQIKHKTGKTVFVEQRNTPIYDDKNRLIAFEGISRDITERKQIEKKLNAHLGIGKAILKISRIFFNFKNVDLTKILKKIGKTFKTEVAAIFFKEKIHNLFEKSYIWHKKSLTNLNFANDFKDAVKNSVKNDWVKNKIKNREEIIFSTSKDIKSRFQENDKFIKNYDLKAFIAVPIISKKERMLGYLCILKLDKDIIWDKSRQRYLYLLSEILADYIEIILNDFDLNNMNQKLEEQVNKRTKELQTSLNELETFSYSVSHDLRLPLRSINGFSSLLVDEYYEKLDDTAKDYFNRIIRSTNYMGQLIDDLLKLSRVARHKINIEQANLSDIVQRIIEELKLLEPDRKTDIFIRENVTINADRLLIEIMMRNLIENSWKFTNKKEITSIKFDICNINNKKTYYIQDNGCGFNMKFEDKLFKSFERLNSNEYEGTGIGLATVKRIADRHYWKIWAESIVDKGTTFYFQNETINPS